jgi:hypothetical protein
LTESRWLRDEFLNGEIFYSLKEAQTLIFSDNAPAIALYHRMGLSIRRRICVTVLGDHA